MILKITKKRLILLLSLGIVVIAINWPNPQFSPSLVAGKRVLVTGASSGIGEQLAYQYARAGASVFITARREALLEKVISNCKAIGSPDTQFGFFPADMSDMQSTIGVIQAAVEQLGGLDQIVLNHAYVPRIGVCENTEESFGNLKRALDINTRSFVHLAMESLPYLKERNGSIGVVSSLAGKFGHPLMTSYSASKYALDGFFTGLRQEVKRFNVSVTIAVLGAIDTASLHSFMDYIKKTYNNTKIAEETAWFLEDPKNCAFEIMRGTTMREREIYSPPRLIRFLVFFRELLVRIGFEEKGLSELLLD